MRISRARECIGHRVLYARMFCRSETGVITSVTDDVVFVRFDAQHPDAPGQSVDPSDLFLILEEQ
jgi:hypothetical protein